MTKAELLAAADKLKDDVLTFAKKRVVGDEIVTSTGEHTGVRQTLENGEEHLVAYVHQYVDLAKVEIDKLEGTPVPTAPDTAVQNAAPAA